MSYTLIRRGKKGLLARDSSVVVATFDNHSDAMRVNRKNHGVLIVVNHKTTRGLVGYLCEQMVVESEGFRCLATGPADSLKQLVEDLSPKKAKRK